MNIGVKYCGGCNPHFDRTNVLNKVKKSLKDDHFEYANENNTYDIFLVINGCSRVCADHSNLKGKNFIFINKEEDYLVAIDLILKHKNK